MPTATVPKALIVGDLDDELTATRRLLERVPDEHLGWKPHAKSMTLGGLALHVANLLFWQLGMLRQDGFDLAAAPPPLQPPDSLDDVLRLFDKHAAALRDALVQMDDAAFAEDWTLRHGKRIIWTQPRAVALRRMGISHLIHHRGQLTVYLRLLDVPLPPIYGATADEGRRF